MQTARKQHYIPQFYLKRWTVDNKLVEFSRPNPHSRDVKPHRKPTKGTGWKDGAYDFEGLPAERRHHLEQVFFHMIDSRAAEALRLIEAGGGAWTQELRQGWVMFMMSMIMRHPADIAAFKAVYIRDFNRASEAEQEAYLKARAPDDPATAEEFFASVGRSFLENMALNNVPKLLFHERSLTSLMNMHWTVAEPHQEGSLFTSDRPVIRTFLGQANSHWALPIGPRKLFLATASREYGEKVQQHMRRQAWKEVNRVVVRQAVKLGYADDERHLPFFQKHLGAATRASIFESFVKHPERAGPLEKTP